MSSPYNASTASQCGFSMIELLSIVAMIGVIGFSAPKALDMLNSAKQITAIDDFTKTVNYAKEQALVRKTTVSLCIANSTQSDCVKTGNNWKNGYLVKVENTGQILKAQKPLPENINIISGDANAIQFSGNGLISSARLFKFCDDNKNGATRNVIINNGSQVRAANFTHNGNCTS